MCWIANLNEDLRRLLMAGWFGDGPPLILIKEIKHCGRASRARQGRPALLACPSEIQNNSGLPQGLGSHTAAQSNLLRDDRALPD
jgi:hypothetical protein